MSPFAALQDDTLHQSYQVPIVFSPPSPEEEGVNSLKDGIMSPL